MVDVETPPAEAPDRTTRNAALWATAIAVPIALVAGLLIFRHITPTSAAAPAATASTPVVVPTAAVKMDAPALGARTAQVCLAYTSQLPVTLRNLPERKVTAGPEQNVAYGEPPITTACGVTQPTECERTDGGHAGCVPLDATMIVTDGVCWYTQDGPATDTFTTMNRSVPVRVSIPASYDQPAGWANEFSNAIETTITSLTTVPTGCKDTP